jgi:hypothetical protein
MLVALIWLGFSVIGQTEVTVEARHDAWSQRFERWNQTPFAFSQDQSVTGDATTTVEVSPLLDGFGNPESSHIVAQANWDHRSVEFRSIPNWRLYVDTAVAARREGLLSQYEDARAAMAPLESIGSTALADALRQAAEEMINPGGRLESDGDRRQRRLELDRDLEKERKRGEIRDLESAIEDQEQTIDQLKESDDENDRDRLWLAEKKLERMKISLELMKRDE